MKDLLSFAEFHLGDGRAADGQRVMSLAALRGMWSMPGPGGALLNELIGAGVSWQIRPTAEDVVVVWHSGGLPGYGTWLMLVPAKRFAIILLTNGALGPQLTWELFVKDWTLRHFVGLRNLPAPPRRLSASELAQYEGNYVAEMITADNHVVYDEFPLTSRPDGALELLGSGSPNVPSSVVLTFYANDYVIDESTGIRSNFLRDESGAVVWLRYQGRLYRRSG